MRKYLSVVAMLIAFSFVFSACSKKADYVDDGIGNIDFSNVDDGDADQPMHNVSYTYPDNPIESIKEYLVDDIEKRGLPLDIGDITLIEGEWDSRKEFVIRFTDGSDNACVVSFAMNDYYLLDGKANPSFTIAFKDHDKSHDMITVLTSVIKYLYPDLSLEEAKELAENQDATISTDGYSMPQDIGGYQVQARYSNPHVFMRTQEFDAKLAVKVTALGQIWKEPDRQECQELISLDDYRVLTEYSPWENDYQGKIVYADFIIKNVWHYQEWVHGDFWVEVDVESMDGNQYTLRLETMRMTMQYEFGVGQRYTLYIYVGSYYGADIICAVQRSVLTQFNSRGEEQPMDYPNQDWDNRLIRVEPEEDGAIYDVNFELRCPYGEVFVAMEGRGIGEKQWPNTPIRDGYEFVGWYDNLEWDGTPYTKDTPIYQNTTLYAKWKYIGSGGAWPRSHHGVTHGIEEGGSFNRNQTISITAEGYNMSLVAPQDQRFRWIPLSWKLSDSISGNFTAEASYSAEFSVGTQGTYSLLITYLEEIFDGVGWQETGQVHEVGEITFEVKD